MGVRETALGRIFVKSIAILPLDKNDHRIPTQADGLSPLEIVGYAKFKAISEEKRSLQIKHEKVCAENKIFKNETEEVNSLNVSIKALKKDVKNGGHKNDKKCEVLEAKIKNLTEFKMVKQAEEKDLKVKKEEFSKQVL